MRAWAHVLLIAVLAYGAATAQEWPGPLVPLKARAEVSGTVVDALSGQPLGNAWVDMLGLSALPAGPFSSAVPGHYQTNTDSGGHFVLPQLYPGQYVLSCGLLAYVAQNYGQKGKRWSPGRLTLQPGEKMTGLVIRLVPTAVIRGHVTDESGNPMQWGTTSVVAFRIGYDNEGNKQAMVVGPSAPAWGLGPGEYRLFGLPPGKYYLEAYYRPLPLWGVKGAVWPHYIPKEARTPKTPKDPNFAYPPILYYPGTKKLSDAAQITVAPGQEIAGIDFVIRPKRAYRVSGWVAGVNPPRPEAKPEMINVYLQLRSPYYRDFRPYRTTAKIGGPFEIRDVMSGSYILWASELLNGAWSVARVPVVVKDADVRGMNLKVRPTIDLTGRLRVAGREGLPSGRFLISLTPVEHGPFGFRNAEIHGDGTFVVKGLNPVLYRLQMTVPRGAYVKSVRLGTQDALAKPIEIKRGVAPDSLSVVVGLDGAQINGTVLTADRHPAADAVVVLVPEGALRGARLLDKSTGADQNGRFNLKGIRPGNYKLFAWDDVDSGAWLNPDFLRRFHGEGTEIEVGEGEQKTVGLRQIHNHATSSVHQP